MTPDHIGKNKIKSFIVRRLWKILQNSGLPKPTLCEASIINPSFSNLCLRS